jgi:bacterioferritin
MNTTTSSFELMDLLNKAIARELQVSVQYMLQHAVEASHGPAKSGSALLIKQTKFMASHAWYLLPGESLKKTAITEMRHAEAISERLVLMGGEPPTEPETITLDKTPTAMLENDQALEREAITLYRHIIEVAEKEGDLVTMRLFQGILSDEEKHLRLFSSLLGTA